jgi:hypothetical protein
MTVQEAAKLIAYLSNCYPSTNVAETMPAVWAEEFADVPYPDVAAAAKQHMREGNKFFPSIPELLAILDADMAGGMSPGEIWSEIRSQFGYRQPDLSPIAWATVGQFGGWEALRSSNEELVIQRLPKAVEAARQELRRRQRSEAIAAERLDHIGVVMLGDGNADR